MTTHWIGGIGRPKLATMSGKAMLTAESSGTVIVPRPISATCAVRFPGTSGCPVRSESDLAFDHHLDQHRLRARHRLVTHEIQDRLRSEEHTSELQSLMRISYAVFCLKKKKQKLNNNVTKS